MNEMLLHYFWKRKIFSDIHLQTIDGREISLMYVGTPHQDAGPDFKQAVIRIGDITWVGDVEIHVRSSDWLRHGHQNDPKYQSIILHVVYQNDVDLNLSVPTLELKDYISNDLIREYEQMSRSQDLLPCKVGLPSITPLQFTSWLSRLAVERFERRRREIVDIVHACHEDWAEATFRCFVANFGFRTNAPAFESLAKSLPYKCLLKHKDSRLQVYALVFGLAGFLEDMNGDADDYFNMLQSEYQYLRYKYQLTPINLKIWNLLRLRPQNFPCVRLAQLSECLYRVPDLIQQVLQGQDMDALLKNISQFEPHPYWKTHRHFGITTAEHVCKIGPQTVNLLTINTIVPVRISYAHFYGNELMKERALAMLENIDFELNSITRPYVVAGFPSDNALFSQALLELYRFYCTSKRCLQCDIGCVILRKY